MIKCRVPHKYVWKFLRRCGTWNLDKFGFAVRKPMKKRHRGWITECTRWERDMKIKKNCDCFMFGTLVCDWNHSIDRIYILIFKYVLLKSTKKFCLFNFLLHFLSLYINWRNSKSDYRETVRNSWYFQILLTFSNHFKEQLILSAKVWKGFY